MNLPKKLLVVTALAVGIGFAPSAQAAMFLSSPHPDTTATASMESAHSVDKPKNMHSDDTDSAQWRPGLRGPKRPAQGLVPGLPCDGRDLLYRVHVDATYVTYDHGKLAIKTVDGSAVRNPGEVCIRLPQDSLKEATGGFKAGDEISRVYVPNSADWRFLGNPGAIVWRAPQTNYGDTAAPVWAGLGAFDPVHEWKQPQGVDLNQVTIRLVKVATPSGEVIAPGSAEGDEQLNIFTENGSSLGTNMISTNLGIWEYKAGLGSHSHANWAFSAPGYWRLYWQAEMNVNGEKQISPVTEQIWAVGSDKDVMLKPDATSPVQPVKRSAESMRSAAGIDAPAANGFDYHGKSREEDKYTPGRDLASLQPPVKPQLPALPKAVDETALKSVYSDEWGEWNKRSALKGKSYEIVAFNDGPTPGENDNQTTRVRIFNDQASRSEWDKATGPLVASEENGWWPTEPSTPNSYRSAERGKVIYVPDTLLKTYGKGTFDHSGAIRSRISENQVYAFDQRESDAPQFSIYVPKDADNLIRDADIYLLDDNTKPEAATDAFMGTFSTDAQTGKDVFTPLAADVDADRRAFKVKAGEKLPVSLVFTKPGLKKLVVYVRINYKDGSSTSHPAPVEAEFRFIVGSHTINQWNKWETGGQGFTPVTEVAKSKPSAGFYAQYNQDLDAYQKQKQKLETLEKGAKGKPDTDSASKSESKSKSKEEVSNQFGDGIHNENLDERRANINQQKLNNRELKQPSLLSVWGKQNVQVEKTGANSDSLDVAGGNTDTVASKELLNSSMQNPGEMTVLNSEKSLNWLPIVLLATGVIAGLGGAVWLFLLMRQMVRK